VRMDGWRIPVLYALIYTTMCTCIEIFFSKIKVNYMYIFDILRTLPRDIYL